MTIGFDIRPLQMHHRFRGIGMHMMHLLNNSLPVLSKGDSVIFYQYEGLDDGLQYMKVPPDLTYDIVYLPQTAATKKPVPFFLKEALQNIRRVKRPLNSEVVRSADVFVSFDFMHGLPLAQDTKLISVAYDLIPLIFPKDYFPNFSTSLYKNGFNIAARDLVVKYLYRWAARETALRSEKLVTISDSTADQFEKVVPGSRAKAQTVYLGAPNRISITKKQEAILRTKLPIIACDYLLYIGGGDPRRKIEHLISSFDRLKSEFPHLKLILAGKDFSSLKTIPTKSIIRSIKKSKYLSDIHLLGFISEQEKVLLYRNAKCFVYPTLSEGFGLPILEAMQEGCPVVSYKFEYSSVQEVAGDAALLTEPNPDRLYDFLRILMTDSGLVNQLQKKGFENVSKFSWQRNSTETLEVIRKAYS